MSLAFPEIKFEKMLKARLFILLSYHVHFVPNREYVQTQINLPPLGFGSNSLAFMDTNPSGDHWAVMVRKSDMSYSV